MPEDSATARGLGGKIGAGVTGLVAQGLVATHTQLTGHKRSVVALALDDFFKLTGSELRRTMGPLFDQLADDPDLDPHLKATLKFVGRGEGQFATMLGNTIIGSTLGSGLGLLISNTLAPAIGRAVAPFPNLPLTVPDAVAAQARSLQGSLDAKYEAAQQGLSGDKFDILVDLARSRLGPTEIIESLNRGHMDESYASIYLQRNGYTATDAGVILELRGQLIDPGRLADLVTFGVLSETRAASMATQSGTSPEDFHLLVEGNGQPPATQDLLEGYRRGLIDRARLEHGITQGPVRNEWIDLIEALRYAPMSVADAIEAAVQGHITQAQSRQYAQQNGLEPSHWQALYDTAGNPPGVQEMADMWRRGILTRAQLEQGIQESRLKNKYVQAVIASSETLPAEGTIVRLVRDNELTSAQGMDLLLQRGYSKDIATALLASAHKEKTAATRNLTGSQIVALYESQAIDAATATGMLQSIGYDADESAWQLSLADLRRTKKYVDATVTRIRAAYLAGRIDANVAASDMDVLRVAPDERDTLLSLWDLERAVPSKQLTEAQVRAAARAGHISWAEYARRVSNLGYADDDVSILLSLYGPAGTTQGG